LPTKPFQQQRFLHGVAFAPWLSRAKGHDHELPRQQDHEHKSGNLEGRGRQTKEKGEEIPKARGHKGQEHMSGEFLRVTLWRPRVRSLVRVFVGCCIKSIE